MSSKGLPVDDVVGTDIILGARSTQQATDEAKSSLSADSAAQSADAAFKFSRQAKEAVSGADAAADRAETAASNAQNIADANTYYITPDDPDGTIAGIAGTTSGETFRVGQGPDGEYSFIYYMNNGGVALAIAREIGSAAIERMLPEYNQQAKMVALFKDRNGKVPIWLDDGNLGARGIAPNLVNYIFNNSSSFSNVLSYFYDYKFSSVKVALYKDRAGRVPVWLDNGNLDVRGFGRNALDFLQRNLNFQHKIINDPVSNGASLWRWKAKKSMLATGISSYARVAWTGDSWTEWPLIAQAMANIMYASNEKAGDGVLQFGIDKGGPEGPRGQQMNGIVISRVGWSEYDASSTTADPLYGCGPDGMAIFTNGTAATLSYSNLTTTSITINYWDVTGAFRYRIDGGAWTTITGIGTNSAKSVVISGLSLGVHSIDIDTTVNTGVVSLLNLISKGSGNGVEVTKLGNGGITAGQYQKVIPYIEYTAKKLDIDVLFMCIGTNDARQTGGLELFESSLENWVNAWKQHVQIWGSYLPYHRKVMVIILFRWLILETQQYA
ncbi:hypothetical protein SM12BL3_12170 [Serratia marcescens]|nr:hypothetical protein SM12BL3_12170 [Serratia marcescens]